MKHSNKMDRLMIKVENLDVSFFRNEILENINFEIEKGSVTAIIGPNGAGKTTLIKAILGLVKFRGKVEVFAKEIGYVPQKFDFDKSFPLSVREFLQFSMREKDEAKLKLALEEVDMQRAEKTLIGELSGGELQRILIARAIVNQPEVLILDEPTAGIDFEGEKGFYDIIRHMNEVHDVTVLMISHEVNLVYKYATKVICLNRSLFCHGVPQVEITDELLKDLFGRDSVFHNHKH